MSADGSVEATATVCVIDMLLTNMEVQVFFHWRW